MDFVVEIVSVENVVFVLVALSVMLTFWTLAAPYLKTDNLDARIKYVTYERVKLRQQQKALFTPEARLRDKPQKTLLSSIVESFNLRTLLEEDKARINLRQAGYRSEKHLVTFLGIKMVSPIVLSILAFTYTSLFFADKFQINMRIAFGLGGLVIGFYLPNIILKNKLERRQKSIKRAWSDALDLLLICVESGMAVEPAMARVASEIGTASVPLAEELTLTVAELSYLPDRRKAFENLSKRIGLPTVKSVVTSLIQAEQYGTPLGQALRVLAQENRDSRMAEAERKAAALPPKLTVPMILFFLPVIFVIVLAPSVLPFIGN